MNHRHCHILPGDDQLVAYQEEQTPTSDDPRPYRTVPCVPCTTAYREDPVKFLAEMRFRNSRPAFVPMALFFSMRAWRRQVRA